LASRLPWQIQVNGAEQKANALLRKDNEIIGRDDEILEMEFALLEERKILASAGFRRSW
jgi:hypothetical protein